MDLAQKLKLSQQTNCIHFFREGMFAHLYLNSLYLAVTQLQLNLKINRVCIQKLNNQFLLRAGMPTRLLEQKLSHAIKTSYGYRIVGDWNCDEFNHWYQYTEMLIQQTTKTITIDLSFEMCQFLYKWEPKSTLSSFENGLIEQIKKRL